MHHHILPEFSLYEGSHWRQVCMPDDFTNSQKSMLDARYEVLQMDAGILLLVFKRNPTCKKSRVFVYKYDFEHGRWLHVFDDYTLIVSIPYWLNSEYIDLHAVARANILPLSIGDQIILCNLVSNTGRSLPPCYNPTTRERIPIVKVACALDPTYRIEPVACAKESSKE
ncbi:hypothetical protein GOP47_0030638 [Adiantum capillus-veneris]|nr:hypothetical protein GOP47_0030638 [Adiantum capillus-veneris]